MLNRQGNSRRDSRYLWVLCTILCLGQTLGRKFKRGRTSLEDEARSRRPVHATDEEMYKKIWDLVYSDRRVLIEEIAQALSISHGSVSTILHDYLGILKLCKLARPAENRDP